MDMVMRWFGEPYDTVSLRDIRQVPGVAGVVSTLYDKNPGESWEKERIFSLKSRVENAGLKLLGIESVNIHDDIKTAGPDRDRYIEIYIDTLRLLGEADVHCVCYNFMPVFDWVRSDLERERADGSFVMAYNKAEIEGRDLLSMPDAMNRKANGRLLPGWEPERMARLRELFALYRDMDEDDLFNNLVYFLKAIGPVCEAYGIRMAIHPDDPPWNVFGLPRIITDKAHILKLMRAVDKPYNGVTLCTGSLGSNPENDIPDIIRSLKGRIHFAHLRNIRHNFPGDFEESAHLSADGSLDMYAIVKALYESGFTGLIRPDHGRMIWGEKALAGYGLYDRALGIAYLNGLWEAMEKGESV